MMTDVNVGEAGKFRLGTVFNKALRMYGRRFPAFFLLALIASIPYYVGTIAILPVLVAILPDQQLPTAQRAIAGTWCSRCWF